MNKTKIINVGSVDLNETGKRYFAEVKLTLKETEKGPEFSACGYIRHKSHKQSFSSGGQCLDEIAKHIKTPLYLEIYELWQKYHLNGMKAGTPEQEAEIEKWIAAGNRYEYNAACEFLRSINKYHVVLNGEVYAYGHKWLYSEIPAPDLERINKLFQEE